MCHKNVAKLWEKCGKSVKKEIERDFPGFPDRFYGTS